MDEITIENLRENFNKVLTDLNILNDFCIRNDISFSIDPKVTSFSPSAYLYQWENGFYLQKLKQTKELNL